MSPERNVSVLLDRQIEARPYQRALVVPVHRGETRAYAHLSFGQLGRRVDAIGHGLRRAGLRRGDRVSVFIKPGFDFPALVFALFKLGAVPVFIDPGMGREAALGCLARMRPRALVAVPLLHAVRPLFASAFRSVEINVTAGSNTGYWGGSTLDELVAAGEADGPLASVSMDPDEEAAILFTSGSTGPAKGARYSHRIYASQTRFIQEMYGIEAGEIDVPGLSVFGLFSLAMGMTVAWPEIDPTRPAALDPSRLVDLIEDLGATNAFGGIAIWRPVLRYCQERGRRLPSLRRLLSAGTAIPVWMHEGFREVLAPGVQIHTPYGATESLPVATIGTDEVLGETATGTRAGKGTCVGWPAPGITIRVIQLTDDPIPDWDASLVLGAGEVGEVVVSGPVVTHLYEGEPEATARAKILDRRQDPPVVWHRLGDLGYQDAAGRLWFCGRKAHRVESASGLLYSNPVEEVAVLHPAVARAALLGIGERGSQEPVIALELKADNKADLKSVAAEVRAALAGRPFAAPIQRVLFHPAFPVDVRHNAKIQNEVLARWASERLARRPSLGLPGQEEGP